MQFLGNKYKYYIDWCGSLYWIEVKSKKNSKVSDIKKLTKELGGYLTIIKTSDEYDYEETIFTVEGLNTYFATATSRYKVYKVKFAVPNINSGTYYQYNYRSPNDFDPSFELSVKN